MMSLIRARRLDQTRWRAIERGMIHSLSTVSSSQRHPTFPNLFTPLDLGPNIEPLPNRVIMGSMHCGLEGHSIPKPLLYLLRRFGKKKNNEVGPDHQYSHQEEFGAYLAERAESGVSLIVTGGIAPNRIGSLTPFGSKLSTQEEVAYHRVVTNAVHTANSSTKILMQILHAGRYSAHPFLQAPSAVSSPLSPFTPRSMTKSRIQSTIQDYVTCAILAKEAGYDGIELMGSEGYLIHQFLCPRTNMRTDEYGGGSYANRIRFAIEIVREIRSKLPSSFIIVFRLSMLDLVENASTWEEIVLLAKELEYAGITILNTGIGWHEARVPTIATLVPRGAFAWVTHNMKSHVTSIPVCTSNRINTPEKVEQILSSGQADLVSMARPFLADPEFIRKAQEMRQEEINTCIACNQACLDHVFVGRRASCLVNPRACHELELPNIKQLPKRTDRLKVAVIGSGPAGLSAATTLAQLGNQVTIYDKSHEIGGQFNMAKRIPGKQEFYESLRYFDVMMKKFGVKRSLGVKVESVSDLLHHHDVDSSISSMPPDVVVVATGVKPRVPPIPNIYSHPKILSYIDVLSRKVPVGNTVAIVGAGGIGVDVAEYLLHETDNNVDANLSDKSEEEESKDLDKFFKDWNVDKDHWGRDGTPSRNGRGGLTPKEKQTKHTPIRKIYLMQRKEGKIGASLGKTTGWIHRAQLSNGKVELISGCKYEHFDEDGNLHITVKGGPSKVLEVDNVVICAGQEKCDELFLPLKSELAKLNGGHVYKIGGAQKASELDAKRAIDMGVRLAYAIHHFGKDENRILSALEMEQELEDEQLLLQFLSKLSGKKLG
jgi:2,4-dienoyl-CoA reductase (NADPH2)